MIAREREIAMARALESGKRPTSWKRSSRQRPQVFPRSRAGQPFVKDDKTTVEKLLAAKGAKCMRSTLFIVGEGSRKRQPIARSDGAGCPGR